MELISLVLLLGNNVTLISILTTSMSKEGGYVTNNIKI
jgi:hypothetical protein